VKTSSLIWLIVAIVVAIAIAVSAAAIWLYPSDRDFKASNNSWNGLKDFSRQFAATNLGSLEDLSSPGSGDTLLCIPYLEYKDADLARIKQFTEGGGDLLLMDDFGYGNDILAYLGAGARFDHNLLLDPLFCYKNQNLPYITDFTPELQAAGIKAVAFNHATVLKPAASDIVLARSSPASFLDVNSDGQQNPNEPAGPFAVAARLALGQGTVTLVSDPSLIINAMEAQSDNSAFIRFLVSSRGKTGHLRLDSGHLEQSPLDITRSRLESFRAVFANSNILLGLTALIFILVIRFMFKKGEIFGK
jgi:hypothetical protein